MNTDTLASLLHDATEDLEPRAGFAGAVVTGGRRRLARRRLAVAASAAVAVLLIGGGTYLVGHHETEQTMTAAEQLLDQPTMGDLAGDAAFVRQAGNEWLTGLRQASYVLPDVVANLRGEPHVYWAGNTPAGSAAVVVQQIYVQRFATQVDASTGGLRLAAGLVAIDPADDTLRLVSIQWQETSAADRIGYFRFGPGDRTALVATLGKPIFYSSEVVLRDHKPVRDWRRMPEHDGVALAHLPGDTDPFAAMVVEGDTQPAPTDVTSLRNDTVAPTSDGLVSVRGKGFAPALPPATGLPWSFETLKAGSTGGPNFNVGRAFTNQVDHTMRNSGQPGYVSGYYIRAGLPDGRVAVISDIQNGDHPARFYALLVTPPDLKYEVYDGGEVNASETLPVHFRMPDKQGWVVAQLGQPLQYRTSTTGQWHDAGMDAALVPDNTVQVMVGTQVVDLPR